ncbi:SagB family peptide dehydrogenase [Streptomyces sp. NPDC016845]|uniref:SagB family peptide dehydrogenase n=1 Tax=Streptomyces sp. NPDC016845 TaxID=3364972 RepID=UPI0037970BAB
MKPCEPSAPPQRTPDEIRYRRNPDLVLEWQEGSGAVLVDCRRWRTFTARPPLLSLLDVLAAPLTAEQAHTLWPGDGKDAETTRRHLDQLAAAGIIHTSAGPAPAAHGLTPYELAAHARAARGPAPHTQRGKPPPARLHHPEADETVRLGGDDDFPSRPLRTVLSQRRCLRAFAPEPLPLDLLGAFLARSARVRERLGPAAYEQTRRPSPSGGGRHSVEIYVLARDVAGLSPGIHHYDPFDHALHRLSPWDENAAALLHETATAPGYLDEAPPVSFYLASLAARTGWKYEGLALSLVYRDTGCLLQTMCLTATDLGLAACPTGIMRPTAAAAFLGPHRHSLLHVGSLALGQTDGDAEP